MTDILSPEVLARYADARIPRYTSYPTAPHFSTAIGEADYKSWLARLPHSPASLYVHIPFCRAMCWYCGCHTTVAVRRAPVLRYLESLHREIEIVARCADRAIAVSHVHFGGGTPTVMPAEQMRMTMQRLRDSFALTDEAEIAVEVDPRTLSIEMAETLGSCGFNRASLGVQSFDANVQRAINRLQSFDETQSAVRALRANGIKKINFDLIYGLPHQTVVSCLHTVEHALRLRPDRLAVFGYAHVPGFKLHQRKIDSAALPDSETRFAQSRAMAAALVREGYVEIGLDHFALPDDPLAIAAAAGRLRRNFQGYTTDEADVLIGLGASSIGRMPQGFVQNEVNIPHYQRLIGEGRLPIARGYRLKGDDRLRAAIIERLMCDHQVDLGVVSQGFGVNPADLMASAQFEMLISDGLVKSDGTVLSVAPAARPLVRSIAAAFDAYLAASPERHSPAV